MSLNPDNWLSLRRVVRFGDTDAAGVMHFYQLFRWCHEAWEESLGLYGLSVKKVFPNMNRLNKPLVFLPIVYCEARFLAPVQTGDNLSVAILPKKIDSGSFQVKTKFKLVDTDVAIGILSHRSINAETRRPCDLSDDICLWLEASSVNSGITSI